MAVLAVDGIEVVARHGVLPEERLVPQRFLLDLRLHVDAVAAAESDRLEDTVDYGRAAAIAADVLSGPSRQLLEALAAAIGKRLLADFPALRRGTVTLHKPDARMPVACRDVSVRYHFERNC